MSYYYKYNFISPEPIYAIIKEEMRSYFDTGLIDDTMFPIWLSKCLDKLGRSSYQILPAMLKISDYSSELPIDFYAVREAWLCTSIDKDYQLPNATYQEVSSCSTALNNPYDPCDCSCDMTSPEMIKVVYKTTNKVLYRFKKEFLLTPGDINSCREYCNYGSSEFSFDIQDNKFLVNFCEGDVNLLYYSKQEDCNSNQMIPDNFRVKEFIEAFLKQKAFEQVFNQTTDETFNQSFQKFQYYKQQADSAYVLADVETKKEDIYKKARRTERTLNRYRQQDII